MWCVPGDQPLKEGIPAGLLISSSLGAGAVIGMWGHIQPFLPPLPPPPPRVPGQSDYGEGGERSSVPRKREGPCLLLSRPPTSTSGSAVGMTATTRGAFQSPTAIPRAGAPKEKTKVRGEAPGVRVSGGSQALEGEARPDLRPVRPQTRSPRRSRPAQRTGRGPPKARRRTGSPSLALCTRPAPSSCATSPPISPRLRSWR